MRGAAIAAAVVLLIVEVALRIVGYAAPAWYQLDTRLGWTLKRHKHGWHFAGGERIAIYINSAEMRDREHPLDKPAGIYRIAVLGDEYSEAFDVPIQRTWWWQLPRALQACTSSRPCGRIGSAFSSPSVNCAPAWSFAVQAFTVSFALP